MKNHGLQVAKLSRFKSGPNISVSYVSFLHAARDLFTAWPAYSVHHCAQSFRADFSDSACKLCASVECSRCGFVKFCTSV